MHDSEKSDSAIVAVKPPNKAGLPVAEAVERRAGAKGKRGPAKHAPDPEPEARDPGAEPRTASRNALRRQTPKVGAGCPNWARPDPVQRG